MDFHVKGDYKRVVLYVVTVVLVLFLLKYILPFFLPLLFAFLIVLPLQHFCQKREIRQRERGKWKHHLIKKGFMAGGILFVIILIFSLLLVGLGTFLVSKTRMIVNDMDFWREGISRTIIIISERIENFFGFEHGMVQQWIGDWIAQLGVRLSGVGDGLISDGFRYLSVMGRIGTFLVVSFICVVLFAREIEGWQQGLLRLAAMEPAIDHILSIILRIGKKLGGMIKAFAKTQTIIFACISVASTIGLYLAGVNEGWFYGVLAGFMDFLPFIGTGIVLIPIAVICIIRGKLAGGIVVIATYFVCVLIREFLEPRLLGNGMKFSPVAILISVYAGVIFYGIGGVILGPVTLLIIVELGWEIFGKNQTM